MSTVNEVGVLRGNTTWWTFWPRKKYLAPPPRAISQFAADTLLAPRPLPFLETPLLGFSIKNRPPPPPGASDSPFPSPSRKEIKNIETSTKTIRGNTTRNSERKMAFWEGLWEGLWKTSENLSKPLKTSETIPLRGPLRDPLRGRFPSQNLSGLLPLIVLPLNLSPINEVVIPNSDPANWVCGWRKDFALSLLKGLSIRNRFRCEFRSQ